MHFACSRGSVLLWRMPMLPTTIQLFRLTSGFLDDVMLSNTRARESAATHVHFSEADSVKYPGIVINF